MASLPPADTEIATRQELEGLRGEMRSLESRMQQMFMMLEKS